MSSDDSGSSLSPSTPHGSRSGMVSSVHIPRQTTPRNSHSTRHKARREAVKSGRSQTGGHARLLTEGDEQLDYNEELPSLKRDVPTNPKSRPHEPHSSSPREEGEEDSDYEDEEDEGDINSSGYEAKRSHHIPVVYRDREEGEASSDDDHRRRVIPIKPNSGRSDLLTSGLSLDEAEYRHRLHKRHERRQRERLGVTSDRSRSQLPVDTMDDSRKVTKVSGHLTSSEEEFEGRRKLIRPGPSDIEYRTSTKEASYDPDASYGKRLSSRKHEPMLVDSKESINPEQQPIHRSQSAANINYDSPSQIRQHRTKSKKSKYDKPGDEVSKKHGKKSKRTVATTDTVMDYAAWESYVYEKVSSVTTSTNSHVHTEVIRTSPHSTSSSSPSSPIRPATRAIPPKQLDAFTESVHDVRSRHRLERDTRESAPPPEPGRSKVLVDTESRKKLKSDKHKSRHRMGGSKRRHRSKERRQPSPSAEEVPVHRAKRSHSKSRRHSRDRLPSPESSPDAAIKKSRRHPPLIPEAEPREERTAAASSSSSSSSSEPDDTAAADVALLVDDVKANSEKSDQVQPPKQEIRPSRFQHYRLYSSSSSEEEENILGEVAAMEDGTGEDLPRQCSTLFDITTPAEVYEQLENRPPRAPSKPYYFPSIQGCRSVEEFECLNRIEEGTYGVVYRARDKKTNEIVALKRLKMEKERDGFPITSLREINTLMKAQHENIVTVREIVVGSNMDKIYLVMDYVEHDLKSLMEIMNGPFSIGEVKCLLMQLLKAVRHLHDNWIIHRDLKTSNLLLSHQGILKVGDFGLAREYGSPLEPYTEVVVTLWYRAPELLLGIKEYSCPIDLWSVGCIFAEFLLQRPLFPGKGEIDQLNMVFCALGTPTEHIWPGVKQLPGMKKSIFAENPHNQLRRRFTEKQISDKGFDLLNSFLTYCPEKRITAEKALNHAYFNERPRAIHPSMFPTWPARSEGAVATRKQASPRPPVGGGALAAAAAAIAAAAGQNSRSRVQPPPPPMGGQRFYSKMGGDSRPGTSIGSGDAVSSVVDKGFLLRF